MSDTTRFEGNEPPGVGHSGIIVGSVIGFIVFAALAMAALYVLYLPFSRDTPVLRSEFPEPQLQATPVDDLAELMSDQRALLSSSRWLDEDAGRLAIPIEAAMREMAGRGGEAYAPLAGNPEGGMTRPPGATAPEDRNPNPGAGDPQTDGVPQ